MNVKAQNAHGVANDVGVKLGIWKGITFFYRRYDGYLEGKGGLDTKVEREITNIIKEVWGNKCVDYIRG